MRKYLFLFILICSGLKISSVQSADLREAPLKQGACWDNFTIPNSTLSGTFKDGILKIYDEKELFNEYDTNQPRYYDLKVAETAKRENWKFEVPLPKRKWTIKSILCDKTNVIYILGDTFYAYDHPLIQMTKKSVTELFIEGPTDSIVWHIYADDDNNIIAHKTPWSGSIKDSVEIQLNTLNP